MLAEGKPGDQTWTEGWCRLQYGAELLAEGFSRVLAKNLISQGGTHLGVGNILENKFGQVKKKIADGTRTQEMGWSHQIWEEVTLEMEERMDWEE